MVKILMTGNKSECIRFVENRSETLNFANGLRQENALASLLFNISLKKIIRNSRDPKSEAQYFMCQCCYRGFFDDLGTVPRRRKTVEESFLPIEKASKQMELWINQPKTKYITVGWLSNQYFYIFNIDNYCFVRVESFTYWRGQKYILKRIEARHMAVND